MVHLRVRGVVNLQQIQKLQWSVQGNVTASLSSNPLSISANYELLDLAKLSETAGSPSSWTMTISPIETLGPLGAFTEGACGSP